jgi:integrase
MHHLSGPLKIKMPRPIKQGASLRGTSWNRTSDTRIFSPLLYQLSYGLKQVFQCKILICAKHAPKSMYTEPKIVTSDDLKTRSYVTFYFNGERVREYNGHSLGIKINPNYASSIKDRNRLLSELLFEFKTALKNNSYPAAKNDGIKSDISATSTSEALLTTALNKIVNSDLSLVYKRDLKSIHKIFLNFLTNEEKSGDITCIELPRIEEFLSRFNSSGTYYMNKRRNLGVLFSSAGKSIQKQLIIVKETPTRRSKAKLHKIYEKPQIKPILDFLKAYHYNLYLCCLITYGCFLRPHREVRNLSINHIKKDFSEIHLSGDENKGQKVRVVFIPKYVQDEIINRVKDQNPNNNIFSLSPTPFNEAYFNTAWTRAWEKMFKLGLIEKDQTIYSFRHTAAVDVYRRTKDVYLLQKLLGHSTIVVTLKYLRGLGEHNQEELKDAAPQL